MQDATAQMAVLQVRAAVVASALRQASARGAPLRRSRHTRRPFAATQFMSSGLPRTAVPSTIHCDHLIEARRAACATAVAVWAATRIESRQRAARRALRARRSALRGDAPLLAARRAVAPRRRFSACTDR